MTTPAPLSPDLRRLLRALGPLPPPVAQPGLVLVAGLPGAGKSTFSRALAATLPAALISSDAVRRALFRTPEYSALESVIVFARAHTLTEYLLRQGISVVFDATSLQERHREQVYAIADRTGARLAVVWMDAPEAVVRERLAARARQPDADSDADWAVYEKLKETVEPVRRPHLVVDSTGDIGPALRRVVQSLRGAAVTPEA